MKIAYVTHDSLDIESGKVTAICTASKSVYLEIIRSFNNADDKLFLCSDDYKEMELKDGIDWEGDVMEIDVGKKYLNELLKKSVEFMPDELRKQVYELERQTATALQDSIYMFDLPLIVSMDNDLKKTLKNYHFSVDSSIAYDPCAIIETDIKIHAECALKKAIGVSGLATYLTHEEFNYIKDLVKEMDVPLLMIDYNVSGWKSYFDNCNVMYIDEDFIDWH